MPTSGVGTRDGREGGGAAISKRGSTFQQEGRELERGAPPNSKRDEPDNKMLGICQGDGGSSAKWGDNYLLGGDTYHQNG